jgi:hypothetical protein
MFWSGRMPEAGVIGVDGEFGGDGSGVDGDEVPGGDRSDGKSLGDERVAGDDGLCLVVGPTGQHIGSPDSRLGGARERSTEENDIAFDERVDKGLVIDLDVGHLGRFVEEHEEVHAR